MKKELENECDRLQKGFSAPSDDTKGKIAFGIGFWAGVETLKKIQQVDAEVKPATAEDAMKIIESIADKTRGTWSKTYDGFDITKDRLKLISQIKRTIKKQLSV